MLIILCYSRFYFVDLIYLRKYPPLFRIFVNKTNQFAINYFNVVSSSLFHFLESDLVGYKILGLSFHFSSTICNITFPLFT